MATTSEDQNSRHPTVYYHALSPQDALVYRLVRLRALTESPKEFSSTFERELGFTLGTWEERLRNEKARTFVATSLAALDAGGASLDSDTWDAPSQFAASDSIHHGMVTCIQSFEDPSDAFIYGYWVSPGSRGRKIGRTLLEKALGWAREQSHSDQPFKTVMLGVRKENAAARHLYELSGFSLVGDSPEDVGELRYTLLI